jgi:hypothetical protein
VTLRGGVHRLQRDFNQSSDTLRVLAVLSPTCSHCLEGYELLMRMPSGPNCLVLWTAMLIGDSVDVAAEQGLSDYRCTQFWEEAGWPVSTRLRPILGFGPYDPSKSAWDVYLLYPPGITWTVAEYPPRPTDWTHNLREHEPERSRISAALLTRWASTATS